MKKLFCLLLTLSLVLSLAACAAETTTEGEGASPTASPFETRYDEAVAKLGSLAAWKYETVLTVGGETQSLAVTARQRQGYSDFSYFRTQGEETIVYQNGRADLWNSSTHYAAEMSTLAFEAYLAEATLPLMAGEAAENLSEIEGGVKFTLGAASLEKWSKLGLDTVLSATGVALYHENGAVASEEITLVGTVDGLSETLILKTTLLSLEKEPLPPLPTTEAISVSHLIAPLLLHNARETMLQADTVQWVGVRGASATVAGVTRSSGQEIHVSRSGADFYLSQRRLDRTPSKQDFSLTQLLLRDNTVSSTVHELTEAKLILSSTTPAEGSELQILQEILSSFLPTETGYLSVTLTETADQRTAAFTLSQEAVGQWFASYMDGLWAEELILLSAQAEGSVSVDTKTGKPLSFAIALSGTLGGADGVEKGTFLANVSLTVEKTEGVTLPELQIPTPTTPGEEVEGDHDHEHGH